MDAPCLDCGKTQRGGVKGIGGWLCWPCFRIRHPNYQTTK